MTLPAATIPLSRTHLSELAVAPPDLIDRAAGAGFASVGLRVMVAPMARLIAARTKA
jgi:hypothetical protein